MTDGVHLDCPSPGAGSDSCRKPRGVDLFRQSCELVRVVDTSETEDFTHAKGLAKEAMKIHSEALILACHAP